MESYAVIWREGSGPTYVGRLELSPAALHLHGSGSGQSLARRSIAYVDIAGVRIARSPSDRLNGSPTVVVDRRAAPPISAAAVSGVGIVLELADVLVELMARETEGRSRVVVVVPIKRQAREKVRRLIEAGPPFDAEELPLDSHHVFVTHREVVFLFEGQDARNAIEQFARTPAVWKAAAAWKNCIAGRPRIADEGYSWARR